MKAIEIERKFLVRNESWRDCAGASHVLQQAYLSRDENSVRVRLIDGRSACLTIKFRTVGLAKDEYEYEIPVEGHGICFFMRPAMSLKKPATGYCTRAENGM